jgi:hypothetical protein
LEADDVDDDAEGERTGLDVAEDGGEEAGGSSTPIVQYSSVSRSPSAVFSDISTHSGLPEDGSPAARARFASERTSG